MSREGGDRALVAFDTSVLVAGLVAAHPHHPRAIAWLAAARSGRIGGVASWHALAETWSVLTRLPLRPAVSGEMARLLVGRLRDCLEVVPLGEATYEAALERCAALGLRSGALFDALHLVCAELEGATCLLTFNRRDFERLALPAGPRVIVPPDPPAVVLG